MVRRSHATHCFCKLIVMVPSCFAAIQASATFFATDILRAAAAGLKGRVPANVHLDNAMDGHIAQANG